MVCTSLFECSTFEVLTKHPGTSEQLADVITELGASKAFIITGRSLYEKTPVIKNIEKSLSSAHGGTFSKIGQHAYVE